MKRYLSLLLVASSLFFLSATPVKRVGHGLAPHGHLRLKFDRFITGNETPTNNTSETYTADWPAWGSIYENYANVTWTVDGGTVTSYNKHSCTILWGAAGPGHVNVYEDLGSQMGDLDVTIQ